MDIQRYNALGMEDGYTIKVPAEDGIYVLYDDCKSAIEALERDKAELELRLQKVCDLTAKASELLDSYLNNYKG